MNYYSFGNPRGTSNSEYGKFSCFGNLQGPSTTQSAYNLAGGQNPSWNNQQGQHLAGCPNNGMSQWNQQAQQGSWYLGGGEGQQGDDGGSNFTVHVGHDAAAAALGGQVNFENTFSMSQSVKPQEGTGGLESSGLGDEGSGNGGTIQPTPQSGDHTNELPQADADETVAENTQHQDAPVNAPPKSKPPKWRGLPNKGKGQFKLGRHVPPSYMRSNQNQQMPMQTHQHQQQYEQGMMEMNPNIPNGNIANNVFSRLSLNSKQPVVSRPTPSGSSMNLNSKQSQNSRMSAQLCGKCTKCKNVIPPDLGPSIMTFPTKSSLRKPSSRSLHHLGQDAKNFRAIRYTNRGDETG